MSHSTVLVIGNDPEAQLEPYDENITVDPYETGESKTYEDLAGLYFKYVTDPPPVITTGMVEAWYREEWGCDYVERDGRYYSISTYNPKSKWDWYVLGGRWRGYFQLKPRISVGAVVLESTFDGTRDRAVEQVGLAGKESQALLGVPGTGEWFEMRDGKTIANYTGRGDAALKRDIDFEAMRDLAGHEGAARFDEMAAKVAGMVIPPTWSTLLAEAGEEPVTDDLRVAYRSHPWRKALGGNYWGEPVEMFCLEPGTTDYAGARVRYIESCRRDAVTPFAVLVDGEWHESARMGWWGMTSDEKKPDDWADQVWKLIEAASDETLFSIYDIHI